MRVLAHLDPVTLERELLARVNAAHPRSGVARTVVIVPTARLAGHLLGRLGEVRPAWLGLEVLHFRSLALRILAEAGAGLPSLVSPRLLRAVLRARLARQPDNRWSRLVRRRPGGLRRLLTAVVDLRESGVTPEELSAACLGSREEHLAALYRDLTTALQALERKGYIDDAGLVRAALPRAGAFASRCRAMFLHGAYELIGVHLELIRALDAERPVVTLAPILPGAPVSAYGEDFARRHLLARGETIEALPASGEDRPALETLYSEDSRPEPEAPSRFVFRHTQGPTDEVRVAVRRALAAVSRGVPAGEIVLAARSLTPHAAAIEEVLDGEGLPWTSSLGTALRRQPVVRDFLAALRLLTDDFPRRATAELLASRRIAWTEIGADEAPRADLAELWSREARLIGGFEEWTVLLPGWVRDTATTSPPRGRTTARESSSWRGAAADGVVGAVKALHDSIDRAPATWSQHASALRGLLRSMFLRPDDGTATAALDALDGLLDEMGRLDTVLDERRDVPLGEAREWIEEAVGETRLTLHREDRGGLRVLDAMQLRGSTCRHLHLLGMNSGVFPRPPREDPILVDALRKRLIETTGRPLPIKSRGPREERQLLAQLLGCARDGVEISWQRADESGRARTPSLALREVARLAHGRPSLARLVSAARHCPSHPEHALENQLDGHGLLSPAEVKLLSALRTSTRRDLESLARGFPELGPGIAMLRATQSFQPVDGSYDGEVSRATSSRKLSVSALETLGRCPLQFFFRHVLRVRELPPDPTPFVIEPRNLGRLVHSALETTYRQLQRERWLERVARDDLFRDLRADDLRQRAVELVEQAWTATTRDLADRIGTRLPVLWHQLETTWMEALRRFVASDVQRIQRCGWTPLAFEQSCEEALQVGDEAVTLRSRFDRVFQTDDGVVVGDYKTSGRIGSRYDPARMLKGSALQVPLYWRMTGSAARVELLGVGPDFAAEQREAFSGFDDPEQDRGFSETLEVLLALAAAGHFPFHSGMRCGWCDYSAACRRNHPPTRERQEQREELADFRLLDKKSTRKPTLDRLRDLPARRMAGDRP